MNSRPPVPNTTLTPLSSSVSTYPTQVPPSVQPRIEQPQLKPWELPNTGSFQRCPFDIVNTKLNLSASRYSLQLVVVLIPPIPKPVDLQVDIPCLENEELSWRARCKPPNAMAASGRHNTNVVNENIDSSVSSQSPISWAANALPIVLPPEPSW